MNVSLTPELEKFIEQKVKSGLFNSASEVIRQALRLLLKQEAEEESRLQALRSAVLDGLQSGGPEQWDIKKFRKNAKARMRSPEE